MVFKHKACKLTQCQQYVHEYKFQTFRYNIFHAISYTIAMSNPSASKRAKLTQLLEFKSKLPAHSQEALESILKEAKKSGIPELVSSNAQKEARLQLLAECHGSALGPLILESTLELEDGTKTPFH